MERPASPRDVREDEGAWVVPSLPLMTAEAVQREHSLRAVVNGRRWIGRAGAAWRRLPHARPPWPTVAQQRQRWLNAGGFAAIVHDLRAVLRRAQGRPAEPSAAIAARKRPAGRG